MFLTGNIIPQSHCFCTEHKKIEEFTSAIDRNV